eukprot:TRINITY_DN6881_c0_g1_i2.p1 TRINITY_DN6881_c0_g1~~TRINITY_DN6881_c0_g1_i2.p1  ORF type:complete len:202 (-),score=55.41 TRINITY_DN6881_c0_g1_i2:645-1250(-)
MLRARLSTVARNASKAVRGDFRSDTVTKPTAEMLSAMTSAVVGDDVYGDDPTVLALEKKVAALANKEAAMFCASGVMANQLALRAQLGALDSVICDFNSHVFQHENGGIAYHCRAQAIPIMPLPGKTHITAAQAEPVILTPDVHVATTKMICLQNALCNGTVLPMDELRYDILSTMPSCVLSLSVCLAYPISDHDVVVVFA